VRKVAAAVAGVLAAAGGVTACGGGHSLSKAEYIKRADAICSSYARVLTKESNAITLSPSFVSVWKDNMTRLRKLKAPKADRSRVAKIWDETDLAFATWLKELKAQGLKAFDDEPAIFHRAASAAAAYGLHDCGT
jgi:hypothetical protein